MTSKQGGAKKTAKPKASTNGKKNGKPEPEAAKALVKGGLLGLAVASGEKGVAKPSEWGAAVTVAFIRGIAGSQKLAARVAGVSPRTVRYWEASDWWHEAEAEAHRLWLIRMKSETRRSLLHLVQKKDTASTRFTAERLLSEFAPPTPAEVNIAASIEHNETKVTIIMPDNSRNGGQP